MYHLRFLGLEGACVVEGAGGDVEEEEEEEEDDDDEVVALKGSSRGSQ
jgi:hypothetical protein